MSGLNADHLFLGVDGLDPEIGLTTPDVLEAQLNSLMIRMAREVTVVADSSKFSKRSLSVIAGIGDVRRVITDHKADPQMVSTLRDRGIEVNAGVIGRDARNWRALVVLAVLCGLLGARRAEAGVRAVWAIGDGDKVKRDDRQHPGRAKNSAWDGRTIRVFGARNEIVAFQVIVEADGRASRS